VLYNNRSFWSSTGSTTQQCDEALLFRVNGSCDSGVICEAGSLQGLLPARVGCSRAPSSIKLTTQQQHFAVSQLACMLRGRGCKNVAVLQLAPLDAYPGAGRQQILELLPAEMRQTCSVLVEMFGVKGINSNVTNHARAPVLCKYCNVDRHSSAQQSPLGRLTD